MDSSTGELLWKVKELRRELGDRVFIPAHHYQEAVITEAADMVGDSYKLAVDVAASDAEYIVFCGVGFMAEGAQVLAGEHQQVLMPHPAAACPMADMITPRQAETALEKIREHAGREIVPVVYMNAHADLKAVCGRFGGAVCTSSNAAKIMDYYLSQGKGVFFFPDQHLGMNTAFRLGLSAGDICRVLSDGSPVPLAPEHSRTWSIYLWDGYCPVHREFCPGSIETMRRSYPQLKVIVHPEVSSAVVQAADLTGSTEQIYHTLLSAPEGSIWAVGTEVHFVDRVAEACRKRGVTVMPLVRASCEDMTLTTLELLHETLEEIRCGRNEQLQKKRIRVDAAVRDDARRAITKMIEITEGEVRD